MLETPFNKTSFLFKTIRGSPDAYGVKVPIVLREAFNKLYGYTNEETTGIRHALMDEENAPTADEAIFMLISCSAFVNYLTKKILK